MSGPIATPTASCAGREDCGRKIQPERGADDIKWRENEDSCFEIAQRERRPRKPKQGLRAAAHAFRQQHKKRHDELADEQRPQRKAPAASEPFEIPDNFIRNIAGPDDDVLHRVQIGPQQKHRQQHAGIGGVAHLARALEQQVPQCRSQGRPAD